MIYDGFEIKSFEAGRGYGTPGSSAPITSPVVIDGVCFRRSKSASPGPIRTRRSRTPRRHDRPVPAAARRRDRRMSTAARHRRRSREPRSCRLDAEPALRRRRRVMIALSRNASADLTVLRVIGGRGGAEYWTLRCISCGGIHLDIVKGAGAGRLRLRSTARRHGAMTGRRSPASAASAESGRVPRPAEQLLTLDRVSPFHAGGTRPIFAAMAKKPDTPKKPGKTQIQAPNSKAHRPDVQPIGPALAELLNPAINRGESGLGSSHRIAAAAGQFVGPPRRRRGGGAPRAGLDARSRVLRKRRRPITAPRRRSRRSIRNWRGSSACRPRRTMTRRSPVRRATRWRRSASRPPRRRWKA